MSRRMDREGVDRVEIQRRINEACAKSPVNERGWRVPDQVFEGFHELNIVASYFYRLFVLKQHMSAWQRNDELQSARHHLDNARNAPAPKLP